jgi:hypothetical protein
MVEYEEYDPQHGAFGPREPRFVYGRNRRAEEESPEDTAAWKLYNDTGLRLPLREFEDLTYRPGHRGRLHLAYLVNALKCTGELRSTGFEGYRRRGSHPFWMSVAEVNARLPVFDQWIWDAVSERSLLRCA